MEFKCSDVEQKSFDDIKRAVTHGTLLAYPDFNNNNNNNNNNDNNDNNNNNNNNNNNVHL